MSPSPGPVREQMKALERLQELDLKIDALKKRKAGYPAALKTLDDSYNRLQATVNAKQAAINEMDRLQRQTEAAMELNRDRLTRANQKLEGVANSQEFAAANKEIDQLKKMNTSLEEQIKKSKADHETASQELAQLTAQHAQIKGDRDNQSAAAAQESGQLDTQIAGLQTERSQYLGQIEPRVITAYERVRVTKGGVGIVPAVGGRCGGCNMMVPPQLYNEVYRATAFQTCPSCHRLMFVPAAAGDAK